MFEDGVAKREWSILQALSSTSDYDNDTPVIILKNAMSTEYDAVGFTKQLGRNGYVWVLSNPVDELEFKYSIDNLSEADVNISLDKLIRITEEDISELEGKVRLTNYVKNKLEIVATRE